MISVFLQVEWLPYVVVALAVWRVSNMVLFETGPWFVFTRLRSWLGVHHDEDGIPEAWPVGSVLECLWCFSVWVALVLAIVPWWFSLPFALSAAAVLIGKWVEDGHRKH
jgi:hypothetical protein